MISIICAVSVDGVIGNAGQLPWSLPSDMKRFKKITMGHTVVMGRKTYESLPERFRPLPGRRNVVLSRTMEQTGDVVVCRNWPEVEKAIHGELETFVIGGSEVFLSAIPWAKKIYRTLVKVECAGDAHFPELAKCWEVVEQMAISQGEGDQYPSTFQVLRQFAG